MPPALRLDVRFGFSTDISPFHAKETGNTSTHKPEGVKFKPRMFGDGQPLVHKSCNRDISHKAIFCLLCTAEQ